MFRLTQCAASHFNHSSKNRMQYPRICMFYILLYVLSFPLNFFFFLSNSRFSFQLPPFFSTTISFSIQLPSPFNYPLLLHSNTLSFSIQLPSPSPFNFPLLLLSTILSFSFQLSSPSPFNYPLLLSTTPSFFQLPPFPLNFHFSFQVRQSSF